MSPPSSQPAVARPFRGSRLTRRAARLFAAFVAVYVVLPPTLTLLFPRLRGEVYPLSMWSMFYRVHNHMEDYGVRVVAIEGKELEPPQYFESAGLKKSHSISAYHAIQRLGRELRAEDEKGVRRARRTLESAYLGRRSAQYEVVFRVWDPYARYKEGTFIEERVIDSFETEQREGAAP